MHLGSPKSAIGTNTEKCMLSGSVMGTAVLIEYILHTIARPKDLAGVRVTVTAGPTQEALDPVRYLTNHSTGKMGDVYKRQGPGSSPW